MYSEMIDWEETSVDYCKLMLLKLRGGGTATLICDSEEWKTSSATRLLKTFGINVKETVAIENIRSFVYEKKKISETTVSLVGTNFLKAAGDCKVIRIISRLLKWGSTPKILKLEKEAIYLSFPYWRQRREEIYLYAKEHVKEFDNLKNILVDELSKDCLSEILRCSSENDVYRIMEGKPADKYWECYVHRDDEIWVNCGSAAGDTILKYLDKGFPYKKIYAFEGAKSEFEKLQITMNQVESSKIELHNEYIGLEQDRSNFDNKFCDIPVTLINMDIEGAEMGVLNGAKAIIKKFRPVLAVCAYHKPSDLVDIPNFIASTAPDYRIFLRKYRGYEPNTLNEFLYYLVPKERCLQ